MGHCKNERPEEQSELLIPGDIYAVKKVGLAKWKENFWCPIPDSEFELLGNALLDNFDAVHANFPVGQERDFLLLDFSFYMFLIQHLHATSMKNICEAAGFTFASGPLIDRFLYPDFDDLSSAFNPERLIKDGFSFAVRRALKGMRFGGPVFSRAFSMFRGQSVWSLGSWSRLKEDYVGRRGTAIDHHYVQTMLKGKRLRPASVSKILSEALASLVADAAALFQSPTGGCDIDVEQAASSWLARVCDLGGIYESCATGPAPETLLLTEVARPVHKAIAMGFSGRNTRVVGFHHGNDLPNSWHRFSAYTETAHCREFVCPSLASARFHKLEYETAAIHKRYPVEFTSAETGYYAELKKRAATVPAPEKVRTIMLIGFPMNANRYMGHPANWFFYQADLEARIAEQLRSQGFKVIYKMHPERREEASGVFEHLYDSISIQPFEDVWPQADAFLFGSIATTTFGYALCLNRPVVFLDLPGKKYNPDAYDLLCRRCELIPCRFGPGDRVDYDEYAMYRAFASPRIPVDMAYVDELMIPRDEKKR